MGLSPLKMTEAFKFSKNSNCNFRIDIHPKNYNMHTVHFGSDIKNFIGAKFWKLIP